MYVDDMTLFEARDMERDLMRQLRAGWPTQFEQLTNDLEDVRARIAALSFKGHGWPRPI